MVCLRLVGCALLEELPVDDTGHAREPSRAGVLHRHPVAVCRTVAMCRYLAGVPTGVPTCARPAGPQMRARHTSANVGPAGSGSGVTNVEALPRRALGGSVRGAAAARRVREP